MRKHAYLIMAYQDTAVFRILLSMIDDARNDIYVHWDARHRLCEDTINEICMSVRRSSIKFIENAIEVYWGSCSQIKGEYILFETAYMAYKYDYYHFISGEDLPIKSQDYIHEFFSQNQGVEYIGFANHSLCFDNIRLIWLFPKHYASYKKLSLLTILRAVFLRFQKIVHIDVTKEWNMELMKGPNWVSVTHDFVGAMLNYKTMFISSLKYAICSDEIYKQTIAGNSRFANNVNKGKDDYESCMRLIEWTDNDKPHPKYFTMEDFDMIIQSDRIFCRKIKDVELAQHLKAEYEK